jgi:SynChlorMet cassette protein ScmC
MQIVEGNESIHRLLLFLENNAYYQLKDCSDDYITRFNLRTGWLSRREKIVLDSEEQPVMACLIPEQLPLDRQLMRATRHICQLSQANGGLLVHGALAERDSCGVILAGPWGVGKSTASGRFVPPWRSLCDDLTLIVRDETGRYRAHPWPTWSRFADGGPGGSWEVNRSVLLKGAFFLQQAHVDRVRPVNDDEAIGLFAETVKQAEWRLFERMEVRQSGRVERFNNIYNLVKQVPSFFLEMSLSGSFWEEIEQAIDG